MISVLIPDKSDFCSLAISFYSPYEILAIHLLMVVIVVENRCSSFMRCLSAGISSLAGGADNGILMSTISTSKIERQKNG
jgi:hypothetical protein